MNFEELMSKKLGGKYAQPPAQHSPAMPSPGQPPVEEVVDKVDSWLQGTDQGSPAPYSPQPPVLYSPSMGLYGAPMSLGILHGFGLFPPNNSSEASKKNTNHLKKNKAKLQKTVTSKPARYANKLLEAAKKKNLEKQKHMTNTSDKNEENITEKEQLRISCEQCNFKRHIFKNAC